MEGKGNIFLTILFLTYIFGFGIFTLFSPSKEVSYYENRALAQEPVKDLNLILSGEYFRQYEEYFSDQFIGREYWVSGYRQSELVKSKIIAKVKGSDVQNIDNFHITNDGWIMAAPITYFPKEGIDEAALHINKLGAFLEDKKIEFYYAILPNKLANVKLDLPEERPKDRIKENKQYMISTLDQSKVSIIDVSEKIVDNYEQDEINNLFFKTDHHWNMDGAFEGYKYFINSLNEISKYKIEPVKVEDFTRTCLEDKVLFGSWNRQLGGIVQDSDEPVCYYNPKSEEKQFHNLEVYKGAVKHENKTAWKDIYANLGNSSGNTVHYGDAYAADYRELNIINESQRNKPNILILKDSYTNPISFHIANHFYQTTIYDMRHNEDRSLYQLLDENQYDIVVILYNENVVSGDMFYFDTVKK